MRTRGPVQQQLEEELSDAVNGTAPMVALNRWATVSYTRGRGRRLSACLWDSKSQAAENCEPDEVVVRVRVTVECVYR